MSVAVKRVVIQIGKKEIELSVEDAKALKEALDGMFEKALIMLPQPSPGYPYTPWSWPWGTWSGTSLSGPWGVSCDGETQYISVNATS